MDVSEIAKEAERRKDEAHAEYAPLPHVIGRSILPRLVAMGKKNRDAIVLYVYLVAHVSGDENSPRYMSAWPSVEKIAKDTGIDKNRIRALADLLEEFGLLRSEISYARNKREKLYYPMYMPTENRGTQVDEEKPWRDDEFKKLLDWL